LIGENSFSVIVNVL